MSKTITAADFNGGGALKINLLNRLHISGWCYARR